MLSRRVSFVKYTCFIVWGCFCVMGHTIEGYAQKSLRHPLAFVPAQQVLPMRGLLERVIAPVTQASPYLTPQTMTLNAREMDSYKKALRKKEVSAPDSLARLFLLSADAGYIERLDSVRQTFFPKTDSAQLKMTDAQQLLNTLGWIAATDNRGVYINLYEDCMIDVRTKQLRFTIDQICTPTEMRYRITGLPCNRTRIVVRLRLPRHLDPQKVYLNGHRLLNPKMEKGYLVIDREWRNNEEVYYRI